MIRFVGTVIVIWWLMLQPLMAAAIPATMMTDNTHSSMVIDKVTEVDATVHYENFSEMTDSLKILCHGKKSEKPSSELCDCGDDCHCATSCVAGSSVAAVHKLPVNIGLNGRLFAIITKGTRIYGVPSRIFHPPKEA